MARVKHEVQNFKLVSIVWHKCKKIINELLIFFSDSNN